MIELLTGVVAALFGALLPAIQELTKNIARSRPTAFESPFGRLLLKFSGVKPKGENEAASLLGELSKTSSDMDRIVGEIGRLTKDRQARIVQLENDLTSLSQGEQELKTRIEGLEKTPLPVVRKEVRLATTSYFLGA